VSRQKFLDLFPPACWLAVRAWRGSRRGIEDLTGGLGPVEWPGLSFQVGIHSRCRFPGPYEGVDAGVVSLSWAGRTSVPTQFAQDEPFGVKRTQNPGVWPSRPATSGCPCPGRAPRSPRRDPRLDDRWWPSAKSPASPPPDHRLPAPGCATPRWALPHARPRHRFPV